MIPALTAEYLDARLRSAGVLSDGHVTAIVPGDMSGNLLRFDGIFTPDTPQTVPRHYLIKTNLKGYPHATAEARFYRDIGTRLADPPLPGTYDLGYDEEQAHCYVLQTDLSYTHTTALHDERDPTVENLGDIVDQIAQIHAVCWNQPLIEDDLFVCSRDDICDMAQAGLPEDLRGSCRKILTDRLPRMFRINGHDMPESWETLCHTAIETWPDTILPRYDRSHLTLIHADLHPGNVLVPADEKGPPLIIDWELLCRGLGIFDVSYLVIRSKLDPPTRRIIEEELIERYCTRLTELGVTGYDLDTCRNDYRLSIVANILPPLAWRRPLNLKATMEAFLDWDCAELKA